MNEKFKFLSELDLLATYNSFRVFRGFCGSYKLLKYKRVRVRFVSVRG